MNRDTWKQIPKDEWSKRLLAARTLALAYLAQHGLDVDVCEDSVAGRILEDDLGGGLRPALKDEQRALDEHIQRLGDPCLKLSDDDTHEHLSERVFGYAMAVAEAGYLFGVITGAHVPWSVVEHAPAPYAPPAAKKAQRSGKKGRAR